MWSDGKPIDPSPTIDLQRQSADTVLAGQPLCTLLSVCVAVLPVLAVPIFVVTSVAIGMPMVALGEVVKVGSWRKRNATEDFAKKRPLNCREAFVGRTAGRGQTVGDHDQLIRIGALIAVAADRRGDPPYCCGTIVVDASHDVPKTISSR